MASAWLAITGAVVETMSLQMVSAALQAYLTELCHYWEHTP